MFSKVKDFCQSVEDRVVMSKYTPKVLGAVTALSTFAASGIFANAEGETSPAIVDGADVANELSSALNSTVTETYAALIPLLGVVIGCNFAWKKVRRTIKA